MDRLRALPTAAIGKYCWWHDAQSCLLTCRRNDSRDRAALVCSAANGFSALAITLALSKSSGRARCGVAIFSASGGTLAPAATRASTIAVWPRFSEIGRAHV